MLHALVVMAAVVASLASGAPVSPDQARQAVQGWLRADARPMNAAIGRNFAAVETHRDQQGNEPLYYVVYLEPSGFAIVAADDRIEPIIAFAANGHYDPSPANPLGALVGSDLPDRMLKAKAQDGRKAAGPTKRAADKWARLLDAEKMAPGSEGGIAGVSDIRVEPLVQSRWSQTTVSGNACYNYYVPPYAAGASSNHPCGCVATAMAQLMRYFQHPVAGVGTSSFTIYLDDVPTTRNLRGGNGSGGAYAWTNMTLVPAAGVTLAQRQAVGALTHDAGVSVNMNYAAAGSGTDTRLAKDAFMNTFGYANAIKGYNSGNNIGAGLNGMVNPNLDAGLPILFGITGPSGGHAIVGDGYGYNLGTLYHHLNLGWAGSYDAWYTLPTIDTGYSFTSVYKCVYNVFVTGTGEIISGRVTDRSGAPLSNAFVIAVRGGGICLGTNTNARGIYAFPRLLSSTVYTVSVTKVGYTFTNLIVTTGASIDNAATSGNRWSNDFIGQLMAPEDVTAGAGTYTDRVAVAWSAVPSAIGYQVWRHTTNDSSAASRIGDTLAVAYNDVTTTAGTTYYYWVKATNATETSGFSAVASGWRAAPTPVPAAPAGVSASDGVYTDKVVVTWSAAADATGYSLWRHTTNDSGTATLLQAGPATTCDDTSANTLLTYYYWVKATNASGSSGFSSYDTGSRAAVSATLLPPANVQASDGTYTNKIRVSWNAADGATSYQIWRHSANDSAAAGLLAAAAATAYDDTSATEPGVTLYYWVKSRNDSLVSAFSQPDAGHCAAAAPSGMADLSPSGFLFEPATLNPAAHPELAMLVAANNGPDALLDSDIGLDVFLSRNTVFGDGDDEWIGDYLAAASINAGSYASVIVPDAGLARITIPPEADGAYYVFARVRHASAILDPNLTNNTTMRAGAIVVGAGETSGAWEAVSGDFDGDRKADPAVYQESTGNWSVKLSGSSYGPAELTGFGGGGWKAMSGDFDGDRKADPAVYQESTGNWRIKLSGMGYAEVATTLGGLGYAAVAGDFDGGGSSDLAVYREATGYWLFILAETVTPASLQFGQDGYAAIPGNYVGGAATEPALYQAATGGWFVRAGDQVYSLVGFGGIDYQPVGGDFDGDGKEDLMLYRAISGEWVVKLSGSGYASASLSGFGGADYVPVAGDYDGDRRADLVIYNAATAAWLFRLSSASYAEFSLTF